MTISISISSWILYGTTQIHYKQRNSHTILYAVVSDVERKTGGKNRIKRKCDYNQANY